VEPMGFILIFRAFYKEAPKPKHQITNKLQIPINNDQNTHPDDINSLG
jgi:hypothetical protein